MSARGRASSCTSTSSSSAASARAAPATASSATAAARLNAPRARPTRARHGFEYVHVMVDDHSRLAYAEVLDALNADARDRLPAPRARLVRRTRRPGRAGDDRQRLAYVSHAHRLALRELGIRHLTHPPLPAPHQPQSRALHPNPAQRIGLRAASTSAHPNAPPQLPPWLEPLQLPTTTRLPQPPTTGHQNQQPGWELHLAGQDPRLLRLELRLAEHAAPRAASRAAPASRSGPRPRSAGAAAARQRPRGRSRAGRSPAARPRRARPPRPAGSAIRSSTV